MLTAHLHPMTLSDNPLALFMQSTLESPGNNLSLIGPGRTAWWQCMLWQPVHENPWH
jgi:hypothetical protein